MQCIKIVTSVLLVFCLFTGCFQLSNTDGKYRTTPVTNNPNNIQSTTSEPDASY